MTLQKFGGIAALIEAAAYIVGFAALATLLSPDGAASMSPQEKLAFALERKAFLEWWNLIIYVLFGVSLVVLASALRERLASVAPAMVAIATVFAYIWAGLVIASGMLANLGLAKVAKLYAADPGQALLVWQTVGVVQDALGGGVEVVGGLWVLLLSAAALKPGGLPKAMNGIGLLVGAAGVLTALPGLAALGAVFGLGQIAWFLWLGAHLLRQPPAVAD